MLAIQAIIAIFTEDVIVARTTINGVLSGAAMNGIVSASGFDIVITGTGINIIIAGITINAIIARPAINGVIALACANNSIPRTHGAATNSSTIKTDDVIASTTINHHAGSYTAQDNLVIASTAKCDNGFNVVESLYNIVKQRRTHLDGFITGSSTHMLDIECFVAILGILNQTIPGMRPHIDGQCAAIEIGKNRFTWRVYVPSKDGCLENGFVNFKER